MFIFFKGLKRFLTLSIIVLFSPNLFADTQTDSQNNPAGNDISAVLLLLLDDGSQSPIPPITPNPPDPVNDWHGSVFAYQPTLHWGYSYGYPSQSEAESLAKSACEEYAMRSCTKLISFKNSCAAIYSGNIVYARTGTTIAAAEENAFNACSAASGIFCQFQSSFCSN